MDNFTEGTISPAIPEKYIKKEDMNQLTNDSHEEHQDDYIQLSYEIGKKDNRIYFYISDGDAFNNRAAEIFQKILRKIPINEIPYIEYECAHTATKHAMGQFGGSACVIARDGIYWHSTSDFIHEKAKLIEKGLEKYKHDKTLKPQWSDITRVKGILDKLGSEFELVPLDIFLKMAGENPTFMEKTLKK